MGKLGKAPHRGSETETDSYQVSALGNDALSRIFTSWSLFKQELGNALEKKKKPSDKYFKKLRMFQLKKQSF